MTNRVTVSLDDEAEVALDELVSRAGKPRSELVRQALVFYAANYDAATTEAGPSLEAYHQMLAGGEHVLLDVDFLHCFLEYVEDESGEPDSSFLELADSVSNYHAREYEHRFETLGELLDWLSFCGFLTVRETQGKTYHVVFPTESVKWFMTRFVTRSSARLPFEIELEEGVSKVLMTEIRAEG